MCTSADVVALLRYCVAGNMYELGADSGRNYSVNVPLKEGMDDQCKWHLRETHARVCKNEKYFVFILAHHHHHLYSYT